MLAALGGCGGSPPPVPPTVVQVTASAAADANPGNGGQGAPVALRIYQLASPVAFNGAEFFALFEKDAAVLKDDLVKRDDLLLAPGQSRSLLLQPEDRVRTIGVFAAYRDYDHSTWRAVVDVPPHKTSALAVTVGKAAVTAAIEPAKPAKRGS